jgi:hypothetical protein
VSDRQKPALRVADSQNHEPLPVRGTIKRARDGELLDHPIQAWDYPILADCSDCETSIRKENSMLSDWKHVE